ncbi:MAG: hypothetical protein PHO70_05765, partial [Candidatus Omnitrophica bacterium]|nr:hypothetical protein [Candidatus Omnitrophota bacterium]
PVDANEQLVLSSTVKVVQPEIGCIPCSTVAFPARECKEQSRSCLELTTGEMVFDKVAEILEHARMQNNG